MADYTPTAPAIHVALIDRAAEPLSAFVAVGAEEEGVPTRVVKAEAGDAVAAAYAAARSSAFGIGLALGAGRIVLHEGHMPPQQPVLDDPLGAAPERIARRFGGNAARMVVRLPLRLTDEPEAVAAARPSVPRAAPVETAKQQSTPSDDEVRRIVAAVVGRLVERGAP